MVFDLRGNEVENKQIGFKKAALEKLLLEWKLHGEVQVAFEACGCFIWVFELSVRVLGRERVHAAHAAKIKMIAQSSEKDDHSDAWWLAYQLYERRLPEAFVAEGELQDLRHAGRELRFYTDWRSDLVRRVRSSLIQVARAKTASGPAASRNSIRGRSFRKAGILRSSNAASRRR